MLVGNSRKFSSETLDACILGRDSSSDSDGFPTQASLALRHLRDRRDLLITHLVAKYGLHSGFPYVDKV
jgi:hypothetical protein